MNSSTVQRKELARNLILLFTSIILSLFILEGAIRVMDPEKAPSLDEKENWAIVPERVWTEYHPVLGWYHEKNKRAVLQSSAFDDIPIRTNSAGFRSDREYSVEVPEGETRLLFLGDSFVFGWGVAAEEAFPAVVETMVPGTEAINMGVAGYGIDQIALSYTHIGKQYGADYVFIGIFPEDFWRATRRFADSGHAKPYFTLEYDGSLRLHQVPVPEPFSVKTRQFPEIIEYSPMEKILMKSRLYRTLKRGVTRLGKNIGWVDPDTTAEWLLGKAILRQLIQEIRTNGSQPVLVLLPPDRWMRSPKITSLHKSLRRFARTEGLPLIDPTSALYEEILKSSLTDYYIEGDWHWSARGHEQTARLIAEWLKSREASLLSHRHS